MFMLGNITLFSLKRYVHFKYSNEIKLKLWDSAVANSSVLGQFMSIKAVGAFMHQTKDSVVFQNVSFVAETQT